ncbi:hypothetical protein [Bdellovibrio bacteriovorus]|uniref:hypothetical protein n=1 Tax=Bdellovibrio bacteriovorus TaxID=959 RepID=UPI0035A69164
MFKKFFSLAAKVFNVICKKIKSFLVIVKKNEEKIKKVADTIVTTIGVVLQVVAFIASMQANASASQPTP